MSPKTKRGSKKTKDAKTRPATYRAARDEITIVALGASAGGIEALKELIGHLPVDTGMGFVVIQHLDPQHHSILNELFAKKTAMSVREAANGMTVRPNHIYVIPPNATIYLAGNILHLGPREITGGLHMPIDHFMRSLAQQKGHRAVGVILSGSGSDGTLGIAEIQAHGGVTFAQEESSAKYPSMPRSAIVTGCVDYVLPPQGIAAELSRIARHPYVGRDQDPATSLAPVSLGSELSIIFQLLRRSTGVDFTHYRQSTVLRRIRRRMVLHKIEGMENYVRFLKSNAAELTALHQDILIKVTSFFRDPAAFEALGSTVFPAILKNKSPGDGIRVWTPGCASGEETYSLAITILEFLGSGASQVPIQFFGTDVSESSIVKARNGLYPKNISSDVSSARLRRFFNEVEGGYRVSRSVREMCIFAQHNILNDPPFSHMDLICCRNLLIYMEPLLQNKVLSLFYYALQPQGFLVLGTSEGVGTAASLFAPEDRAHKIFSRKSTAAQQSVSFSLNTSAERSEYGTVRVPAKAPELSGNYLEAQREFDRRILTQYSPATVFVNQEMEIIHTRGNVERYLMLAPGRASLNLLKMVREGLVVELRKVIHRAIKENSAIGKRNLSVKVGETDQEGAHAKDSPRFVNFEVIPVQLGALKETYFMIVFQEAPPEISKKSVSHQTRREAEADSVRVVRLDQEITAMKEYLQSVIETLEATNEELQSANEEILSSNEELQSTNEEMETAKEELQSTNEELTTVNDELRSRNVEVMQINSDLTNLLSSIDIAVIMIGSDLTIRRFTPKAKQFLGLISADIGRPLLNINPTIEIANLQAMVMQVVADFRVLETELTDKKGVRYQLKVLPYRALDNKIDGAVITIVDIAEEPKKSSASTE